MTELIYLLIGFYAGILASEILHFLGEVHGRD